LAILLAASWPASQAQQATGQLAFRLERQLPLIQARIDGQAATLLLDLGGTAALALRPNWDGLQPDQDVDKTLETSAMPPTPVPTRIWKKSPLPPGVDGYVGYGYLKQFALLIDYRNQIMQLSPPGKLDAACGNNVAPLQHLGSLAYVRFEQDDRPLLLGLDTGANQNVSKDSAPALSGTARLAMQSLDLGPFRQIKLPLPRLDGILGYEFFARHLVCLDAQSATFAVTPK
jgi:hypothetical protein